MIFGSSASQSFWSWVALEKIGCALYLAEVSSERARGWHLALLLSTCVLAGFMQIVVNLLLMWSAARPRSGCHPGSSVIGTACSVGFPVGESMCSWVWCRNSRLSLWRSAGCVTPVRCKAAIHEQRLCPMHPGSTAISVHPLYRKNCLFACFLDKVCVYILCNAVSTIAYGCVHVWWVSPSLCWCIHHVTDTHAPNVIFSWKPVVHVLYSWSLHAIMYRISSYKAAWIELQNYWSWKSG